MSSLEDLAAVRTVIELCNNSELKKEILRDSGSDYELFKQFKEQWINMIENKAGVILGKLGLTEKLRKKVTGLVILIGLRMLMWTKYHERTLGLTREFGIKFLNSSFFTPQGIIDNKKTAEELMKDESLSITQKFKLACLYCLKEHILDLYKKMSQEDKEELYDDQRLQGIKQPEIVKFWSYYLLGQIDKLRGEKSLDRYRLETAVKSGSKEAVEYCLEKTSLRRKEDAVIDAALETVRNKIRRETAIRGTNHGPFENDWVVFLDQRYSCSEESWIPSDYFVDILHFLFSKMREDQKIEFLKKDIEGANYEMGAYENLKQSKVLEYFLDWPYQNYFMKTAQLTWDYLPERSYAELLFKICEKINPEITTLKYGEEKTYDYRKLFGEFWRQSPDHFKRYMCIDNEITLRNGEKEMLIQGKELLCRLFALKNFSCEDWKNIKMILNSATDEEKERIIFSKEGKHMCILLMGEERWEILEEFVSNCLPPKEQTEDSKRDLSISERTERKSCLPNNKIIQLKGEMFSSRDRTNACVELYLDKGAEIANRFCNWCFSSDEETREFKKEMIFSVGVKICADLILRDKLDDADELVVWSLLSQEEIAEFKNKLHAEKGNSICENLISRCLHKIGGYFMFERSTEFRGGKWDQVEKYLTWCFSSEEEISDFKKRFLKESGKRIHFNLINSNQWQEAATFFGWLELSPEEVKELKKETLFDYAEAFNMFSKLMFVRESDERFESFGFSDYGSRLEGIGLLLRWYLTDEESVLEFRDHFKQNYVNQELSEEDTAVLEDFDLAIEERLSDLVEEQRESLS